MFARLLVCLCLLLTQCQYGDPAPVAHLPPATQTGANTFGCLVNGQTWTPKGNNGRSNYSVYYDPGYRNGTLNISAYRYADDSSSDVQYITLASDSLKTIGSYPLTFPKHQEALFSDSKTKCEFLGGDPYYRRGTLTITRLDQQAGIVSGTFSLTLYRPGCDSVRVTQGRFDKKL